MRRAARRPARQIERAVPRLEFELGGEQLAARLIEERRDLARSRAPPPRPPRILELSAVTPSGKMHVGENGPDPLAVARERGAHRDAGEASDERCGLPVQGSEILVALVGDRSGDRKSTRLNSSHV